MHSFHFELQSKGYSQICMGNIPPRRFLLALLGSFWYQIKIIQPNVQLLILSSFQVIWKNKTYFFVFIFSIVKFKINKWRFCSPILASKRHETKLLLWFSDGKPIFKKINKTKIIFFDRVFEKYPLPNFVRKYLLYSFILRNFFNFLKW